MAEPVLFQLGLILVMGIGAYWLAWRFDLPAILLLLLAGFVAGPVTGWLDPDALFGDLLLPLVSVSVAIILFEGGLTLRIVELEEIGKAVRNLVTVGVLATWAIASAAAYLLLDLGLELSLLLGAILVVTGPTVIIPLMRQLRPKGAVGHVLKWEGILIDPIGVILAVVVFEAILAGGFQEATANVVLTIIRALVIGGLFGILAALVTYVTLKRHWVPDILQNPVTLALVVASFAASEFFQPESGLVAATIMGVVLANQEDIAKRHILEFKENLRVLLLSFLFVVLAARLEFASLSIIGWDTLIFLGVLVLLARPVSVLLSTLGTPLDWRERTFLSFIAPRGVVAAAISSVFALGLAERGVPGAEQLVPIMFFMIVATVSLYGFLATPLGRLLGIADPNPQGALIVGAHPWAREIGVALQDTGLRVLLVDTNRRNLQDAWDQGLQTHHGSTLHEYVLDDIDLGGIGNLLALTPNDEVNALTTLHFQEVFDRSHLFQLPPGQGNEGDAERVSQELTGRLLFGPAVTYGTLTRLHRDGWRVQTRVLTDDDLGGDKVRSEEGTDDEGPIPLFLVKPNGVLRPFTASQEPMLETSDLLIYMAPPEEPSPDVPPPPPPTGEA